MIHRLIVMRHAKSSWDSEAATDHARPLNPRGRHDAPRIGQRIESKGWLPDLVLSSDSTRTRETCRMMCAVWTKLPEVEYKSDFYHGSVEDIQAALATLSPPAETVLVLGHNPGWEHASRWFSGEYESMTTANAALLQIEAETWAQAAQACGEWTLVDYLRPRELD